MVRWGFLQHRGLPVQCLLSAGVISGTQLKRGRGLPGGRGIVQFHSTGGTSADSPYHTFHVHPTSSVSLCVCGGVHPLSMPPSRVIFIYTQREQFSTLLQRGTVTVLGIGVGHSDRNTPCALSSFFTYTSTSFQDSLATCNPRSSPLREIPWSHHPFPDGVTHHSVSCSHVVLCRVAVK